MSELLHRCLDDLARRIDEREEERQREQWIAFLDGQVTDGFWVPAGRIPMPPQVDWPRIPVNAALEDVEAMLLQQFGLCSEVLATGGGSRLNVRCNYGTVIIPSLFDCAVYIMPEETDTLPGNHPLPSLDAVRAAVDRGVPDVTRNYGGRVFAAAERFLEVFTQYPVLRRNIILYHPDTQGPADNTETIWGSTFFYAFYDDVDLLRDFLNLQTETYAAFMRRWYELVPPSRDYSTHWGIMHRGVLVLRNDSLMNLSPETYVEFIRPCDQQLFDEFEGGAIHFCGRGDHYIERMSEMKSLTAIIMSQPELNDMETIYRHTIDQGIKLLSFDRQVAQTAGRPLRGQVQCF